MAKAKFDSAKLKQQLAAHGEKIGFVAALLLMGYMVYAAMGIQPYKLKPEQQEATKPEDLKAKVDSVRNYITGSDNKKIDKFNLKTDGVFLPDEEPIKKIDRLLVKDVTPSQFGGIELNKPLFDTKQRRSEPSYLALRDLRATFHNGAINFVKPGAPADGNKMEALGEEWLSVTGIVPVDLQTTEYIKAFQNALDTTTGATPVYVRYMLQRAEVDPSNPDAPITWGAEVDPAPYIAGERARWVNQGAEYVDASFVREALAQALPPLPNNDYGDWAGHLPEIPKAGTAPGTPAAPAAPGAAPVAGPFGAPAAAPAAAPGAAPAVKSAPAYALFRFIDFNVEPRKTYRYRVKLVLANPNYNLNLSHLEKPQFAEGETRETEWSAATPPVTIPVLERYFGSGVKSVSGDGEPAASAGVQQWYPPLASDAYFEFDSKFRGAMLNDGAANVSYVIPGERKGAKKAVPLTTETLLVDFAWEKTEAKLRGPAAPGTGIEPRCSRPSELLVYTPRGEMLLLTELGDTPLRDEAIAVGNGGLPANFAAGAPPASATSVGTPATTPATGTPTATPAGTGTPVPAPSASPSGSKKKSIFDL